MRRMIAIVTALVLLAAAPLGAATKDVEISANGQTFSPDAVRGVPGDAVHWTCEIHGSPSGGMDGVVKVPAKVKGAPAGLPFTVTWAKSGSETGSSYDVQYRVGRGTWKSWMRNSSARSAVFGKNGKPESAANGTTYRFRARSGDGSTKSRWSPKVRFTP